MRGGNGGIGDGDGDGDGGRGSKRRRYEGPCLMAEILDRRQRKDEGYNGSDKKIGLYGIYHDYMSDLNRI